MINISNRREAHTYSRQDRGLYAGTHIQFGSSISESHKKTARNWLPNTHSHTISSPTLGRRLTLRMPASVWRTINNERYGGNIDKYLTSPSKAVQRSLGLRGEQLRNEIRNKLLMKAHIASIPKSERKKKTLQSTGQVTATEKEASAMEGAATGM